MALRAMFFSSWMGRRLLGLGLGSGMQRGATGLTPISLRIRAHQRATGRSTRKSKMPWRDVIFTGDGIILPPSWTQSGLNGAACFATGGIVLPPSISKEERVLLDLLATETHVQAKPRSPAERVLLDLLATETHVQAKPRWKAERPLLNLLAQNETHFQAKPWSPANATGEANNDALSTATTPTQSRRSSAAQQL
ncbi:hypothetical protein T484DRAFT_2020365 [Baffinella frigidus]|nr:hypothetical protein T484DRAFT_2020365 [Cryptophyta sp. CCMP2293]